MIIVYADANLDDISTLNPVSLEFAFGADENDFELVMPYNADRLEAFNYIYIDGTELGGMITDIKHDAKENHLVYHGLTWHGLLENKIIEPDEGEDYLSVTGEVNEVLTALIARIGLSDIIGCRVTSSGSMITNYKFNRYVDAYSGIRSMLNSIGLTLAITCMSGSVVAESIAIKTLEEKTTTQVYYQSVNHLICLGKGELKDRIVVHLYADKDGKISQTQSLFGVKEKTEIYDYNNVEEDKLIEEGTKKLLELQTPNSAEFIEITKTGYSVDDKIASYDSITDVSTIATIEKKIVTINHKKQLSIEYQSGSKSTKSNSSYSGSSGGSTIVYNAGNGISIDNYTISAEVNSSDLSQVNTVALNAITTASNAVQTATTAHTVASDAMTTADTAQETADEASEAAGVAQITADKAQTTADGKADANHTHLYAGSSTAGGAATSALKLSNTSDIGSTSKGVYFTANGVPAALSASVGGTTRPVYYKSGVPTVITSVAVAYGGTGATTAAAALTNLGAAAKSHTHTKSQITDFPASLPASDVSAWAKASTKPSYSFSELTGTVDATTKLSGVIPAENLPSYVDDVLEYAGVANFPTTGETGKIYVDTTTNKTYRWSGTGYVVISETIALGETSSTAYRGDRGKIAYDHSQTTGNPHGTTKANLGLANVENKSSATIRGELTKANVTTALGYTPPTTNTTYSTGTATKSGLTKLYTSTGTATNGTMTQSAITTQLSSKAASSHTHTVDDITDTLPITKGGTGATTAADARVNLNVYGVETGTYPGFTKPNGDTPDFIRSPKYGFIPYSQEKIAGYGTIGTTAWPFKTIYGKTIYGDTFSGNSATATKLKTARTITITGAVNGSATFNGSSNVTINTTGDSAAANFLAAHPVGSIYETTVSDNPATLYGGTWEAVSSLESYKWIRTA